MKISPKKYAEILYHFTAGKSESQIKQIIKEFANIIIANQDTKKLGVIVKKFADIWNKNENTVDAKVKSAEKLDSHVAKNVSKFIADIAKVKNVELKQEIDEKILGGVVIAYNDKVIDGSLRTKLQQLRDNMIK